MRKMLNMPTGKRYGRLTVLSRNGKKVLCRCDCGQTKTYYASNLNRGASSSCGCLQKELTVARSTKHGYCKRGQHSAAYNAWCNLRKRCTDPNGKDWHLYGGRGIKFHPAWLDFSVFLACVGEPPSPDHSLDRWPNVNGNYEPGNVRWATLKQQANNTRKNVRLKHNGLNLTLAEWADKTGLDYHCLYYRYEQRWSTDKILSPSGRHK